MSGIAVLASAALARRRPVYFNELAQFLVAKREQKQWQQKQAAEIAQRRGLKALTRQVLLRLEKGQTKTPDPEALRAIATLYGTEYSELVTLVMRGHYGIVIDLPRHSSTGESAPSGGIDGATATRLRESLDRAEAERDVYRKILERADELVAELAVVIRPEGRSTARAKTPRGGRPRKNRG